MKMSPMKKSLVLAGLLLATTTALAMGPHDGKGRHDPAKMTERLSSKLELNEGQRAELQKIMEEAQAERKALHEQMKAQRQRTDEKITGLLNEEQRGKFEAMKAERKKRMQERRERFREQRRQSRD